MDDSLGWICEHLGVSPEAALHRRRARLDRRQPVHLSRHGEGAGARLAAEADHPRGRDSHAANTCRRILAIVGTATGAVHAHRRLRPLAPGLRHRGLSGGRGPRGGRPGPDDARGGRGSAARPAAAARARPGGPDRRGAASRTAAVHHRRRRRLRDADVAVGHLRHAGERARRGRRRVRARAAGAVAPAISAGHAGAGLVAGAGRVHARARARLARRAACTSPARRRTCGSARRSTSSASRSASSSASDRSADRDRLDELFAPFCQTIDGCRSSRRR